MSKAIDKRQNINKKLLLEQLKKIPVVEVACQKTGIGRATYYRWRTEDKQFEKESDLAIRAGRELGSDMAESQILKAIKEGNLTAAFFWLRNHSKDYANKLEISTSAEIEELTPEQQETVRKALALSGLNEAKTDE